MNDPSFVVWLTGLPCSGKSTLAERLSAELRDRGLRHEVLDGDRVRQHLSQELGYSRRDRDLNVLRVAFVAELLARNGVPVIVAVVSPFEAARAEVRRRIPGYFEVHVHCPLAECERRDVKGMYARARAGKLPEFTGIDSPYEPPVAPDLRVNTAEMDVERSVAAIIGALEARGRLRQLAPTRAGQ
jgi:adenylylsulfate kinase